MKYKLITVVGTRPELIRLSSIIKNLDVNFDHILIHTNQNFDKNLKHVFFKDLGIKKPKYDLNIKSNNAIKTISEIFIKINEILDKEKPDAFFVLGDTNSSLSAIVAKKKKIPVFHYEAGNRCFDQRVPEEINRKLVDHIADINLTYSNFARENLLREGFAPDRTFNIGSPLGEVIQSNIKKINNSNILKKINLDEKDYFLVSFHRQENVDDPKRLKDFLLLLSAMLKKFNRTIIVSTHPRTEKKISIIKFKNNKKIKFLKPFGFFDYMKLQKSSIAVISDSGSISEEASYLSLNAISLRDTQERQEAMSEATVIMSSLEEKEFMNNLNLCIKGMSENTIILDYKKMNISEKVSRIINSYIPYIKREVFKKY